MNYPMWRPSPPKPDANVPWHPQTHWDIDALRLEDLPTTLMCAPDYGSRIFAWNTRQLSPNQIKAEMKELFFRNPTARFVRAEESVLALP